MTDREEIIFVLGTRPEIIKTAPIIHKIRDDKILNEFIIHTNQHYDESLSSSFFSNLNLPIPDANLNVGSGSHANQTAEALPKLESIFKSRNSPVVLAQGDTNAVLSTAIAASKTDIKFGHIEAGIRSFDRDMPEEVNRLVADNLADILFAPTEIAVENLKNEGKDSEVYNTGNTIMDACKQILPVSNKQSTIIEDLGLEPNKYVTVTIHRPINTDNPKRLELILKGIDSQDFPVVFPCHPRTKKSIEKCGYRPTNMSIIDPLDYLDFLKLQTKSRLIVTDSGGIQEEASILEVPCLTVRPNTERPETIRAGVNTLIEPTELYDKLSNLFHNDIEREKMVGATDLYGRGDAANEIVEILKRKLPTQ